MVPSEPTSVAAGGGGMVLALTTEASQELAEALARAVLEAELAACVALTPCRSLYRWQGVLEQSLEVQLLLKTHASRLEALQRMVHERHSYTTPEWISWPARASDAYGAWLGSCCGVASAPSRGPSPEFCPDP